MKRLLFLTIGCAIAAVVRMPAATPGPVRLDTGLVSGTVGASGDIRIFRGIPYAAPPVGELRWQPPQPAAHWDGVRKADAFGPRCMQTALGGGGRRGGAPAQAAPPQPPTSEDCLSINVWTPATSASERRPVMVFTYGGGYYVGAGSEPRYDGEALAKKGVVVVTSNYRLGPFGWFAHPELTKASAHHASGNYGLMDAIAALEWVQRNVAAFGGDPRNVTIFGESAGAFSVSAMVGSPEAKGLFQHAIAESGAWMGLRMAKMTTRADAEEAGTKMLAAMGAKTIADARAMSADDLLHKGQNGGLIVDGWYVPEDLSLTFAHARQNGIDVLVGSNRDEGTLFQRQRPTASQFATEIKQRWGTLADSVLALYPAANDEQAMASSLAMQRDEITWHARLWAADTVERGKRAFVYYFTHVPPSAPGQPSRGAAHTTELAYVFGNLLPAGLPWSTVDRRLADQMTSYWSNFAKQGDPNGTGLPTWPAYTDKGTSGRAMVLGDEVMPEPAVDTARLALYDALYARQMTR
ncbi:MAG TPA: carboxylesterase family protein [Vicinamibacterales bacterium]|nr:carboxylesterase family protein [Vicinamibacterales bacterium]